MFGYYLNPLTRRLAGHDREIQRLLDAYQAEAMTVEELKQRRQQIEVHRAHVLERLHDLQHQRDDRDDQLRLIQGAELFCASIQQALVDPSFSTKQQVLQLVVDRIVVTEGELVVHHIIPAGPFRLQTEVFMSPATARPMKMASMTPAHCHPRC